MYRVLLAVDEDEAQARELASAVTRLAEDVPELEVVVFHVFRDVDVPRQVVIHQPLGDFEKAHDEQREVPQSVHLVSDHLRDHGVGAEVRIEHSDSPARTIVEFAEEHGIDDIYVGGRTDSPLGKVLFGSVAQAVLLNTDVPVTVVGSTRE